MQVNLNTPSTSNQIVNKIKAFFGQDRKTYVNALIIFSCIIASIYVCTAFYQLYKSKFKKKDTPDPKEIDTDRTFKKTIQPNEKPKNDQTQNDQKQIKTQPKTEPKREQPKTVSDQTQNDQKQPITQPKIEPKKEQPKTVNDQKYDDQKQPITQPKIEPKREQPKPVNDQKPTTIQPKIEPKKEQPKTVNDQTQNDEKKTTPQPKSEAPKPVVPPVKEPSEPDFVSIYAEIEKETAKMKIEFLENSKTDGRFGNIYCPKETNVKLDGVVNSYLHANHIKFEDIQFIATQFPRNIDLFWIAAKNYGSVIVDITNENDSKKTTVEKGFALKPYAPTKDKPVEKYGTEEVQFISETPLPEIPKATHCLYKSDKIDMPRIVYPNWEDHQGPDKLDNLDHLITHILTYMKDPKRCPIVHCRAGVGRTGTFITCLILRILISKGTVTEENLLIKMREIILQIRKQRGHSCVQNDVQYKTIWMYAQKRFIIEYFEKFEQLQKSKNWNEIIKIGEKALALAKWNKLIQDEARISAHLTSTSYYQGNYKQALIYAQKCHELSKEFTDPSLFIQALYLESASFRALAGKEKDEKAQQELFQKSVDIAQQALSKYDAAKLANESLKGKIFFNLGAALADNPKATEFGAAADNYAFAIVSFQKANDNDAVMRTKIRLGTIRLKQKDFAATQKAIETVRAAKPNERTGMLVDYLDAKLKLALKEHEKAMEIAKRGLATAKKLGAKEDELRFEELIKT